MRNVWGPVGRIYWLTWQFTGLIHYQIHPTIRNLYWLVKSVFKSILTLLYILTFWRSFSVLCSLFSRSNFCLMRSCCFSWASCNAFDYDKKKRLQHKKYITSLPIGQPSMSVSYKWTQNTTNERTHSSTHACEDRLAKAGRERKEDRLANEGRLGEIAERGGSRMNARTIKLIKQ